MSTDTLKELWKASASRRTALKSAGLQATLQSSPEARDRYLKQIDRWANQPTHKPRDGKDGQDGRTPRKEEIIALIKPLLPSKDELAAMIAAQLPTDNQLRALIQPLIPAAKEGKAGKDATIPNQLLQSMVEASVAAYSSKMAPTADEVAQAAIPLIEQKMNKARKGWFGGGGGGDQVRAGTGVTITTNNIGAKVISSTLTPITITGTIDDSNTDFTAASEPTLLCINGAFYQQTGGAITWTYTSGAISTSAPVGDGGSIFGL